MKHMKRILSVLLLISLLPLLPLTAAAEGEAGGTPTPKTVYVSSSGDNATAAVGDKTKPYADFLTAYGQLTQTGGTVVLLDDVTIDLTTGEYTAVDSAHRFKLPASEKGIAICGTKQEDGQYSKLIFTNSVGICVELQGNLTLHDLVIEFALKGNLWFAANGYSLTIGFRFSHNLKGGTAEITGGAQSIGANIEMNTKSGPVISIYSGSWNRVMAGPFCSKDLTQAATIMLFGGTMTSVTTVRSGKNSSSAQAAMKASTDFHYYGGSPAVIKAFGKEATLHLYNGMTIASDKTDIAETNIVTHAEKSMPAPDYALNFYGTQVTAVNGQGKYSVRFVGTLHSADYSAVGLLIRTASQTYGGCCEKVYTSILGDFDRYTAEALGGNYLFAWTIQNIPADAGSVTFTVTPFLAVGDTVWYGQEKSVTYQAGILQQ